MSLQNSPDQRYAPLSISLHWLMLALIVGAYALIELRELFPKGSDPREAIKTAHFVCGLLVGGLTIIRLGVRLVTTVPDIQPPPARWQQTLAGLVHVLLYVFMIGLPLLGWLTVSAAGKPVSCFGLTLPMLIGADKTLAHLFKEIHEAVASLGYGLIGLHAAAALYHHYILRDNTLLRMLPRSK